MSPVLLLSGALIILISAVEIFHFRARRRITFLTAAHVLILVGYCLPPFFIALLPDTPWALSPYGSQNPNPWGVQLYILDLADALRLPVGAYLSSGIILSGGYAAMLAAYFAVPRRVLRPLDGASIPASWLLFCGLALGIAAIVAMAIYASQYPDMSSFLGYSPHLRVGRFSMRWGYLQVFGQIALPASIILAAAAGRTHGWRQAALLVLAAGVWSIAILRGLHGGGRIEFAAIAITPFLAWVFVSRNRPVALAGAIALGLVILLIATFKPTFFSQPVAQIIHEVGKLGTDTVRIILHTVAYLGFPHIAAAHTLTVVPGEIDFRYFADIPLGLAYMLPNFTGIETLPPMILSLHVRLLPWIPVDLLSFGYYSLGTLGALACFAAFGAMLALFDGWLTESAGWLGQALRVAWLFYLPFRILYADPYATLQSGFGLIAGTLVIAGLTLLAGLRRG